MRKLIATAAIATLIAGCAKSPESIAPAYVSPTAYNGWDCKQLAEESQRVSHALQVASQQQQNARNRRCGRRGADRHARLDLSGDNIAPQIADLKASKTL